MARAWGIHHIHLTQFPFIGSFATGEGLPIGRCNITDAFVTMAEMVPKVVRDGEQSLPHLRVPSRQPTGEDNGENERKLKQAFATLASAGMSVPPPRASSAAVPLPAGAMNDGSASSQTREEPKADVERKGYGWKPIPSKLPSSLGQRARIDEVLESDPRRQQKRYQWPSLSKGGSAEQATRQAESSLSRLRDGARFENLVCKPMQYTRFMECKLPEAPSVDDLPGLVSGEDWFGDAHEIKGDRVLDEEGQPINLCGLKIHRHTIETDGRHTGPQDRTDTQRLSQSPASWAPAGRVLRVGTREMRLEIPSFSALVRRSRPRSAVWRHALSACRMLTAALHRRARVACRHE